MRWGALLAACFALVLVAPRAAAQTSSALVVPSCGSQSYTTGQPAPITIDATGLQCNNSSGGGGATVGFSPTGQASLTATNSSSHVAFGSVGPTALITNNGAVTAFINFGNSSVTATTSSYPVNPGQSIAFNIGSNTNVAGITSSGSAALSITTGTGIPTVSGVVATPSNPTTVTVNAPPNDVSNSGALTSPGTVSVNSQGAGSLTIIASGSGTGLTYSVQGSSDGVNYVNIASGVPATGAQTAAGTTYNNQSVTIAACPAGFKTVRVNLTAISGGTETFALNSSAGSCQGAGQTINVSGKNGSGNSTPLAVNVNGDVLTLGAGTSVSSKQVANNTTSVAIDANPGTLYQINVFNNSGTIAYLKLYNASQGSTTCGSGTPVQRILIPANTNGAGAVIPFPNGVSYSTAITACTTTGFADGDTTAPAASTYIEEFEYQ